MERDNRLNVLFVLLVVIALMQIGLLLVLNDQRVMIRESVQASETEKEIPNGKPSPTPPPTELPFAANALVRIDVERNNHAISPLIYGVTGASADYLRALRPTLHSWGGRPSSRYNWKLGNAWNTGAEFGFRNSNYGHDSTPKVSDTFLKISAESGADTRLVVPTLGWVARNSNKDVCSFRDSNGDCYTPDTDCTTGGPVARPNTTSVVSSPEDVVAWIEHIKNKNLSVRFVAMGNEPELWGKTHYDVHPRCTTYDEIRNKYIAYAAAVRKAAPDAELTGPVTCCWQHLWNSAAGEQDKVAHNNQDFLPWFLDELSSYEQQTDTRILDVLDIHYYPEGLYQSGNDSAQNEKRLRATRSLWDPSYVDESPIAEPIYLIPRLHDLIETHYPELKLGISEWNFGADDTMNGALAIADVLGIFGREDLYFANYWQFPAVDNPGFYAFKLYTNYDDDGGRFGDLSVSAESDTPTLAAFSALNSKTGALHVMLINRDRLNSAETLLRFDNFDPKSAEQYTYAAYQAEDISLTEPTVRNNAVEVNLPAYGIAHIIITGK